MKAKWFIGSVIGAALFLPAQGHARTLNLNPKFVQHAGIICSNQVLRAAKDKIGKSIFASLPYKSGAYVYTGGIAPLSAETSATFNIPYATATALDGGNPGSAWRACMVQNGAPVPKA